MVKRGTYSLKSNLNGSHRRSIYHRYNLVPVGMDRSAGALFEMNHAGMDKVTPEISTKSPLDRASGVF